MSYDTTFLACLSICWHKYCKLEIWLPANLRAIVSYSYYQLTIIYNKVINQQDLLISI